MDTNFSPRALCSFERLPGGSYPPEGFPLQDGYPSSTTSGTSCRPAGITPYTHQPGRYSGGSQHPPPGITRGGSSHENKNKVPGTAIMRNLIIGIALTAISVVIVGLAYIFIGGILLLGGVE